MDTKLLEEVGFTPKEIDVYIALLSLKASSIFELMNRAKVSRKSIYEILQKLLDKGLASYTIKDGRKKYQAASPERLIEILKEKEENVQTILPELLKRYKEMEEETKVELFMGKNGMKAVMNGILKEGKPMHVLAGEGKIHEFLKYYMPQFFKRRVKLKINAKMVYNESVRGKFSIPLAEIRYIQEKYSSPLSKAIYGNNVSIFIFSETPLVIHIKSKEVAKSFMNYFNLMWKIAKK